MLKSAPNCVGCNLVIDTGGFYVQYVKYGEIKFYSHIEERCLTELIKRATTLHKNIDFIKDSEYE